MRGKKPHNRRGGGFVFAIRPLLLPETPVPSTEAPLEAKNSPALQNNKKNQTLSPKKNRNENPNHTKGKKKTVARSWNRTREPPKKIDFWGIYTQLGQTKTCKGDLPEAKLPTLRPRIRRTLLPYALRLTSVLTHHM